MPRWSALFSLAQALDVSVEFLMGGQVQALEAVEFRTAFGYLGQRPRPRRGSGDEQLENYLAED